MSEAAKATTAPGDPSGQITHDNPATLGWPRRTVREVGYALMTAGVIILLFTAYELLGTNVSAHHHQVSLSRQFNQTLRKDIQQARHASTPRHAPPPAHQAKTTPKAEAPNPSVPLGGAIDHMVIPAIGLNRYVVQGTGVAQLQQGPGHYVGTALPGQDGNVAIAGHRTTFGAPFFELNQLKAGDVIELTDLADRTWVYRVTRLEVVSPTDVSVIAPTKTARLTLTTCTPRYWATYRLVAVASLVGRRRLPPAPAPTPAHPQTASPRSPGVSVLPGDSPAAPKRLGGGDGNAWPGVIGFGFLVVAGLVLVRLLAGRSQSWRRAAVLGVGIVVCAVPLWFAFGELVRLLPANL